MVQKWDKDPERIGPSEHCKALWDLRRQLKFLLSSGVS